MYQKMMDKEFGIKAIAFIFSVSEESIKKILMKAQKMHYKTGEIWCASSVQLIQLGETPNLVTLGAKRPVSSPWALYREVQC